MPPPRTSALPAASHPPRLSILATPDDAPSPGAALWLGPPCRTRNIRILSASHHAPRSKQGKGRREHRQLSSPSRILLFRIFGKRLSPRKSHSGVKQSRRVSLPRP